MEARQASRSGGGTGGGGGGRGGRGRGRGGSGPDGPGGRGPGRDGEGAEGNASGPRGKKVKKNGRRRFIDYPRYGKKGVRRWLPSIKQILAMFLFFIGSLIGLAGLAYSLVDVPDINAATQIQSNIYYYADGVTEIGQSGKYNRQNITLDQVPKPVQHAVLAAENRTFYSDSGVSPKGLTRAALAMAKGGPTQGGSTITQQYVKNAFLNQEQSFERKFKEMFIAIKVDRQMSKDDILAGYLNTSFYGRNSYGIQAAAQAYYGKNSNELTVGEGAYIATLLNAPSINDVFVNGEVSETRLARVQGRWKWILNGMVEMKWLTQAEADAQQFPMPIKPQPSASKAGQAGYLMQVANNYLINNKILTEEELALGGYKIITTIDKAKQDAAVAAVDSQLTSQLKPDKREADKYLRTAIASVIPGDGAVVALYGGPDFLKQEFNDATRRDVQVGSTFKPFVVAAGLRDGKFDGKPITIEDLYNANNKIPVLLPPDGKPFKDNKGVYLVPNEDGQDHGQLSIRKAMEQSLNPVFTQLAADIGFTKVRQSAIDAGLSPKTPGLDDKSLTPSMALGSSTPTALDMADAYATFAARGKHVDTYVIKELRRNDKKVDLPAHESKQVYAEDVADTINDMLQGVIQNGTGKKAKELGRPAAGKTGTTDENRSAWFVGYTPNLATSVGLFRQDQYNTRYDLKGLLGQAETHGGAVPTAIWTAYMKAATKDLPAADFVKPENPAPVQTASPTMSSATSTAPPTTAPPTEPGGPTTPTQVPETTATAPTGSGTPTPTGTRTGLPTFFPTGRPTTSGPPTGGGPGGGGGNNNVLFPPGQKP
ncbi:transglycosylase domain-containing protein [Yinghuangia seranimata]|uniref:transglycosylase domain-containing protein n=1 Tax=Yinghuangia seranimata TaxID=408067 RepID=UPI00248C3E85|nr:transglycosylase domain-containing protein [Yinghuangia seranimata]MDI2130464.1 transglycosylase domain-containing protein [Yinghuangia seranimata]